MIESKKQKVSLNLEIMQVKENTYCVDFSMKEGDLLSYVNFYKKVRSYFGAAIIGAQEA